MIPMNLAELTAIVGGELHGDPSVSITGGVEYDTRALAGGGLFVAFVGEKVDGHDLGAVAAAAGAVAALGSRALPELPTVVVADATAALSALARALVDRLPQLTIVGLTGSSGKTTTKDYLAQLLSELGPTVAPRGSLNNELGLPYTVCKAGVDTRYLVLELGARGPGHIAHLCAIAPPRIGVELNVGEAHAGEFGSLDVTAAAKAELVAALPADGLAVLNADDPRVRAMETDTKAPVVLYGESAEADVRAVDVTLDESGRASFTLVTAAGTAPVRLAVAGAHQVGNTLAAATVALHLGAPLAQVAAGMARLRQISSRRMDVFERRDGVTVIDDSYNANPASMAAALRALSAMGAQRRTVAVLGYMAELGDTELASHTQVGRLAAELGVDEVLAVGAGAEPIAAGARSVRRWTGSAQAVPDQAAAISALRTSLRPGDVVVVKGSRYRTWDVADFLREAAVGGDNRLATASPSAPPAAAGERTAL